MIRAIPIRILCQILLVIVGADAIFSTEIAQLRRHGHSTGRLSVEVIVDSPVDSMAAAGALVGIFRCDPVETGTAPSTKPLGLGSFLYLTQRLTGRVAGCGGLRLTCSLFDIDFSMLLASPTPAATVESRNDLWLRRHPWFEGELLPKLPQRVAELLA
jgi:hypothetical protein